MKPTQAETATASRAPQTHSAPSDGGFAAYIHWPFCAQKCPYCDFNSHVRHSGWDEHAYLQAYLRELATTAARITNPRPLDSIFFGGGTPSLMQPETVSTLIEALDRTFGLDPNCEITLEANPGSVDAGRFRGYRTAGVNRISIGIQALDDDALKKLGRIHSVAEALKALDVAKTTFERISFDLIYARPGMTPAIWEAELKRALALQAGHLSLYQLTIEDGTPFAALHRAGKLIVPDPETADTLYGLTQDLCAAAGLPAYEISNHATPGNESRHNLVYWRYGSYLGLGPGAHGRELRPSGRHATTTERSPERWLALVQEKGTGTIEDAALTPAEQADELLLMGLRLTEGVDLARLADVGGVRPKQAVISRLVALGMLDAPAPAAPRLKATTAGRFVLNEIVRQLSLAFEPASGT
ncbi:MAG: radical SAM family heme chaperone HemW [Hyphomicrobiaceae bacterium]